MKAFTALAIWFVSVGLAAVIFILVLKALSPSIPGLNAVAQRV